MLGAGCSMPLLPSWSETIASLIDWAAGEVLRDGSLGSFWHGQSKEEPPEVLAQQIKERVGPIEFQNKVASIFDLGPGRFTSTHQLVSDLNLAAIVTTNYDLGIHEARLASHGCIDTNYFTWKDDQALRAFNTNELTTLSECPLLFAHGVASRADTIVFAQEDYVRHYESNGRYFETFKRLWGVGPLLFVGFSFQDRWLELARLSTLRALALEGEHSVRHYALVALRRFDRIDEQRAFLASRFGVQALFYDPSDGHAELQRVLRRLPRQGTDRSKPTETGSYRFGQNYFHETTEDQYYASRTDDYRTLGHLARDYKTRVVGVTGIGGQGKTSLIGSWLKSNQGDLVRPFDGLFYWSFYNNSDVQAFLRKVMEKLGLSAAGPRRDRSAGLSGSARRQMRPVDVVSNAVLDNRLLLVLDGLEVLQEAGERGAGEFLVDDLRDLLTRCCRGQHKSLVILTSRFPFSDLNEYQGAAYKAFRLPSLSRSVVGTLLSQFHVANINGVHDRVADELEGHPLAIRVFVAALLSSGREDPDRLLDQTIASMASSPLDEKINRLLHFYAGKAPPTHLSLLGSVAMFNEPEPAQLVVDLTVGATEGSSETPMWEAVDLLVRQGLVLRERVNGEELLSCHPVLRDYFRSSHLRRNTHSAETAATHLEGRPGESVPTTIEDLKHLVNAIEVLVEAGYLRQAISIYERRLKDGHVFLSIPAFNLADRVLNCFFRNRTGEDLQSSGLARAHVRRLTSQRCEFSAYVGDLHNATRLYLEALKGTEGNASAAVLRRNLAKVHLEAGNLDKASDALSIRGRLTQVDVNPSISLLRAYAFALKGDAKSSSESLAEAHREDGSSVVEEPQFLAVYGVYEAEVLAIFERFEVASAVQRRTLAACEGLSVPGIKIHSLVVGAEISARTRATNRAINAAEEAVSLARGSQCLLLLPRAITALNELRLRNSTTPDLGELEDALNIARSRNMILSLIKGLTAKAKAISVIDAETGKRCAGEALRMSLDSGYVPGMISAEECLAEIESRLGETYESELHTAHATTKKRELFQQFDVSLQSDRHIDVSAALKRLGENPNFHIRRP